MTEAKKRFADRYFETLNATKSAIYAGYSEDTAGQQGHNLLGEVEVQEYLEQLRSEWESKSGISKEKWLSELSDLGFSNIQDYIEGDLSIKDLSAIDIKKAAAIASIKRSVTTFDGGEKETIEFKLHDKLSALDKIGRHFGYFEKDNDQSNKIMVWNETKTYAPNNQANNGS